MEQLRHRRLGLGLILLACWACSPTQRQPAEDKPVDLIVVVTVDMLPAYVFQRYDSLYTGGLRRLLTQGRVFTQALHDHAATWTSTGHATLSTGVVPAKHGIVANEWYELADGEWQEVPSVDDASESIVGVAGKIGMSPRNLEASGLADWILAADTAARIVSLSGKRTASTLIAGQTADAYVYYFEDDVGRFVTSTYYRNSDPDWLTRFNQGELRELLADSLWDCEVPANLRSLARADAVSYENDRVHTAFPHRAAEELSADDAPEAFYDWWDHTPKLDRATVALAKEAIAALELGARGHIDYLALGLSQLDRVGHFYGPLSLEQLDALLRVDRLLADFFDYLDTRIGEGRYVVALTSDHGVVQLPEFRQELGLTGRYVTASEIRNAHRLALAATPESQGDDRAQTEVIRRLEMQDYVADVMTLAQLAGPESADSFVALYQQSYFPGRIPGVLAREGLIVRLYEGMHTGSEPTTHGSPYLYDRHVPLIFLGPGTTPGFSNEPVRSVDVTPTLAHLAGIPAPEGLDGRPLDPGTNPRSH